jgi:hypothetical protein
MSKNDPVPATTKLETVKNRSSKEVKEILQSWLEKEDIVEILIIGKRDGGRFAHEVSSLSSLIWWMGILRYFTDVISDYQKYGDD